MTFTLEDIQKAFENEQFETQSYKGDWYAEDSWSELGYGEGRVTINGEEYNWKSVEYIGGEGQGEYTAVLFEIDGRTFRKEGYYASHYGTDWDGDLEEVEAYEKTVTSYRPVS